MNSLLERSRYLNIWLGCLPGLLAFAAYTISTEHVESVKATLATDRFVVAVVQLLSTVKDAETGQRGYLLTGQDEYLAPYRKALQVIHERLARTEVEASANGVPQQQVRQMHALVMKKLDELRLTIDLRQSNGLAAALQEVKSGRGQRVMDDLRELVATITTHQAETLASRLEHQRHDQFLLEVVLGIGVISGILTLYLVFRNSALYTEERDRAETLIRNANETLELRVKQRTEELQRSNDDLLQFAYIASHDLQEPLRTVSSYVGLLARRYANQLDETAQTYIQYAIDGAARMQTLINDLLQYSRAGTQELNKTLAPVERILRMALRNLDVAVRETGAVVRYPDLPDVLADESKLTQVFQNLVGNAIKFRKPGQAPEVTIGVERESDHWVFSVSDNGVGFEDKYTDRIFQVFQRLHGVGKYPGNGIGLAISKRIVEHHGGRLWATSRLGEGACFYFTLPAQHDAPGPEKPRTAAPKGSRKAATNV